MRSLLLSQELSEGKLQNNLLVAVWCVQRKGFQEGKSLELTSSTLIMDHHGGCAHEHNDEPELERGEAWSLYQ